MKFFSNKPKFQQFKSPPFRFKEAGACRLASKTAISLKLSKSAYLNLFYLYWLV